MLKNCMQRSPGKIQKLDSQLSIDSLKIKKSKERSTPSCVRIEKFIPLARRTTYTSRAKNVGRGSISLPRNLISSKLQFLGKYAISKLIFLVFVRNVRIKGISIFSFRTCTHAALNHEVLSRHISRSHHS